MPQTIGTTLRSLRQQRDLTQAELAQLLDVSVDTVRRWEADILAPELALIPKLAFHLQTEPEALTGCLPPSSNTAPSGTIAAHWFSLVLSIVGFLAAAFLNWIKMPLPGFIAGGVFIAAGILLLIRYPAPRWMLLTEPVLFSALLPLIFCLQSDPALPALRWITYGAAFAAITAVACSAAYFIFLFDRKAFGDTLRICLRYGLILLAVLSLLGLLHFFLQYLLTGSQLLYSDSVTFDNWDDFRNYMQTPLSSDGKTTMTLLSIEEVDHNLIYRFSDPNQGIVEIRDAYQIIPSPVDENALCTYLHLNQFVYSIKLSSQGNLPVQIVTVTDHFQAQQTLSSIHIVFILLYLGAIAFFLSIIYKKTRKEAK